MLPQLINIIAGFILGSSKLKEIGGKDFFEKIENALRPHHTFIGWITLIAGVVVLLERTLHTSSFQLLNGDSFPQAIPLILIGLILLASYFEKYPAVHNFISLITPYKVWIGLWGMLAGLISLTVGCPVC